MQRYFDIESDGFLNRKAVHITLAASILVFIIDIFTPKGMSEYFLYLLLLIFYWRYSGLKHIYPVSATFIVFIFAGFFFSPGGVSLIYSIINRSLAVLSVIALSQIIIREKTVKKINTEILERVSDLFIALDSDFNIVYMNKALAGKTSRKDYTGKNIFEIFPALKNSLYEEKLKEAISTQKPVQFKMMSPSSPYLYNVSVYPSPLGVSVFSKDITALDRAETKIRETLKEKEMLLREIHHRVKNNFQLVSSLMNLSLANINDVQLKQTISMLQNRIRTLALIHEKLYQSGNVSTVNIQSFVEELFSGLCHVSEHQLENLSTKVFIDDRINLQIQSAIPLGLIINELYTNSLKHAFNGIKDCRINLSLKYVNGNDDEIQMVYSDNGNGFKSIPDVSNAETLGFTIISSFVEQLQGKMNVCNNNGAEFQIQIKV